MTDDAFRLQYTLWPEEPTAEANLPELRPADLIAKVARVTLKDTMRVLLALDAVAGMRGVTDRTLVQGIAYDPGRPTPKQVAACESAYYALRQTAVASEAVRERLEVIQTLV